jgi:hypothetical protein
MQLAALIDQGFPNIDQKSAVFMNYNTYVVAGHTMNTQPFKTMGARTIGP